MKTSMMKNRKLPLLASLLIVPMLASCGMFGNNSGDGSQDQGNGNVAGNGTIAGNGGGSNGNSGGNSGGFYNNSSFGNEQVSWGKALNSDEKAAPKYCDEETGGLNLNGFDNMMTSDLLAKNSKEQYFNALCSAVNFQQYNSIQASTISYPTLNATSWEWLKDFITEDAYKNRLQPNVNKFLETKNKDATSGWSKLTALAPVAVGTPETHETNDEVLSLTPESDDTILKSAALGYLKNKNNDIAVNVVSEYKIPMYNVKTKKIDVIKYDKNVTYVMQPDPKDKASYLISDWNGDVQEGNVVASKTLNEFGLKEYMVTTQQ